MRPPGSPRERLAARIDRFTDRVGRAVGVLFLCTVVICFATVYLRYALGVGYIWLQELYVWTHALTIMFGGSYCFLKGGFVRIDILYRNMGDRAKAWVDLFGTIVFMAPFLWMMATYGWAFFMSSLRMKEGSQYTDGLPALYLLKSSYLFFVALMALQGIAVLLRCTDTLRSRR